MKITKTQLKEIIKEEVSRLQSGEIKVGNVYKNKLADFSDVEIEVLKITDRGYEVNKTYAKSYKGKKTDKRISKKDFITKLDFHREYASTYAQEKTVLENRKKAIVRELKVINEGSEEFVPEVGMIAGNQTDGLGYKGTIEHVGEDYFVLRNTKTKPNGPILIEKSRYKQFKDWGYHLPNDNSENPLDNMFKGTTPDDIDF